MHDRRQLKEKLREACEKSEYDAALGYLVDIQVTFKFTLLAPQTASHVSEPEIDEILTLLQPLMQLHLCQHKLDHTLLWGEAIIGWLAHKPLAHWKDDHWRMDCNVQHVRLACYQERKQQENIEAVSKAAIYDGEKILKKEDSDWSLLLSALRVLNSIYFNRQPRDVEAFIQTANRMVEVFEQIKCKTMADYYTVIDTYANRGCLSEGDEWLVYADQHRVTVLKKLWERKNFKELCDLVDEFDDIESVKLAEPNVVKILEERWEYVYQQPGYDDPLVLTEVALNARQVFTLACVQKDVTVATENIKIIAHECGVKLFEPYLLKECTEKKAIFVNKLLDSLAKTCLTTGDLAEAVNVFVAAIRWSFLIKQLSDASVENIIDTYQALLKACHKNSDHEDLVHVCRSLFAFCDRTKLTQQMLLCLVNAHHLLGTKCFNEKNVGRMQRHYEEAEKYWEMREKIAPSEEESDIRRAVHRHNRLAVIAVERGDWLRVERCCQAMTRSTARLKTLNSEDKAAIATCEMNLTRAREEKNRKANGVEVPSLLIAPDVKRSVTYQAFLKACERNAGDPEALPIAKSLFEELSKQMGFALLEPAQIDSLPDEEIYTVFEVVDALAKLYQKNGLSEAAVHAFRIAVEWNAKLEERSDKDERECFLILYRCTMLNFSISAFNDFLEDAESVVNWGGFIKNKTAADYEYLAKTCWRVGHYFREKKEDNSSNKWFKKADSYCSEAISGYQRSVSVFKEGFEKNVRKNKWEKARQYCDDAEKVFDALGEVVEYFYAPKKFEQAKNDIKTMIIRFITILGGAYNAQVKSYEHEHCEMLLEFILKWYDKFERNDHDNREWKTWLTKKESLVQPDELPKSNGHDENGVAHQELKPKRKVLTEEQKQAKAAKRAAAKKAAEEEAKRKAAEAQKAEEDAKRQKQFHDETKMHARFFAKFSIEPFERMSLTLWNRIRRLENKSGTEVVLAACTELMNACDAVISDYKAKPAVFSLEQLDELMKCTQRFRDAQKLLDNDHPLRMAYGEAEQELHSARKRLRAVSKAVKVLRKWEVTPRLVEPVSHEVVSSCAQVAQQVSVLPEKARICFFTSVSKNNRQIYPYTEECFAVASQIEEPVTYYPEECVVRVFSRAKATPIFFFRNREHYVDLREDHRRKLVVRCENLLHGLLKPLDSSKTIDPFVVFARKLGLENLSQELYQIYPDLIKIKQDKKHSLYPLLAFLERCCDESNEVTLDFCSTEKEVKKICVLLFNEMKKTQVSNINGVHLLK